MPTKRAEFSIPPTEHGAVYRVSGSPSVYLCGNSLGLAPKRTRAYLNEEMDKWEAYGVEGHFRTVRVVWMRSAGVVHETVASKTGRRHPHQYYCYN